MSVEELKTHINEAIEQLKSFLHSISENNKKKAMLIAYWIKTYVFFQKIEDDFNPKSLIRYKKGNIVLVDFGFRVGKELGGLHYAIVLDNENSYSSHVITVVPLTSLKNTYKPNKYTVLLKDGIYNPIFNKTKEITNQAKNIITESKRITEQLQNTKDPQERHELANKVHANSLAANILLSKAKKHVSFIESTKDGSIANLTQITTISKIRIKAPINNKHILYKLKISEQDMKDIDSGLKDLYFHK